MASTLVLRSDAQEVGKRFYAGEDPDALARSGVGRDRGWKPVSAGNGLSRCAAFNSEKPALQRASVVLFE